MAFLLRRSKHANHSVQPIPSLLPVMVAFVCGCLVTWGWLHATGSDTAATKSTTRTSKKFRGNQYWKPGATLAVETLYETPFARFQIHKVQLENGKTVIPDWMWFDESDNINVLVEKEPNKFWVLRQSKYAFAGSTLAVVGGLIELNESPLQAAQRELLEELNLVSTTWESLGAYRAAANRGGGTTHTFLARQCQSQSNKSSPKGDATNMAIGESERQDLVELTQSELLQALLEGQFQEVKWSATVALALLKILQGDASS